jgi:hypothetical protein
MLASALAILLSGCSSGSRVQAGPIVVTIGGASSSQQAFSLGVSQQATMSMTPVNDSLGAGVDWTVNCQGSPVTGSITGGACGTISPVHTASGGNAIYTAPSYVPIGGTVIITAAATSNPSATSSVTVTISQPSISIQFTTTPPTTLQVSGSVTLGVLVKNDPANAGASWTVACASTAVGACGTLSSAEGPTTIYTAPATPPSGAVTVTAASISAPTAQVSAVITITPAPPISVTISPASFTLGAALTGETASLVATVVGDNTNAGVDWTLSCTSTLNNCGSIAPSSSLSGEAVNYKAPPTVPTGGTVTITATAIATESGNAPSSANAIATIISSPTISVSVSAPASLSVSSSTGLTAIVTNDASNSGVTWSVTCGSAGACGSLSGEAGSGGVYTATYTAPAAIPAGSLVTIIATPNASTPTINPGLASIDITAIPPTVSFLALPPAEVKTGGSIQVSAVVTNDTTPPGGVQWSVQCTDPNSPWSCGAVSPYQTASGAATTYTAPPVPPAGPVTIVAAAASTCSGSSCNAVATASLTVKALTALSINFVPLPPTQLQVSSSSYLIASVSNDSSAAGVDWTVCSSGCGYFTIVPEIPAPPTNPTAQPTLPVTATSVSGWPNGLPILYTAPQNVPASDTVAIQASAHANGAITVSQAVFISTSGTGPALDGTLLAGNLPVTGAQIGLYAAGTSGYGSAATLISPPGQNAFATTDSNGKFTISAGYSCPQANSQMYIVALGGTPSGASGPNPSLAFMSALGPCSSLSTTRAVVNEITTVASARALAPFAANPLTTGLNPYLNIGTSSGNTAGLANAFASVNNLVNFESGQPLAETPAANATVPYAAINTLADILSPCAVSTGGLAGDGSVCGTLFTLANPYRDYIGETVYSGTPTDTLQAAFEIAQNPNYPLQASPSNLQAAIDGLTLYATFVTPASPYQPILATIPDDFSISLNFSNSTGTGSSMNWSALAVDSAGNLWISDAGTNSVRELNNQGVATIPGAGYTTSTLIAPGPIAIDSNGYMWTCGQDGLTELNFVGQESSGSPFLGSGLTTAGCSGLVMDGTGNIWASTALSVSKFDKFGNPLSPAGGYTIATSPTDSTVVGLDQPIAIDDSGNVWVGVSTSVYSGFLSLAELNNASGLPNYLSPLPPAGPPSNFVDTQGYPSETQIAIDSSGNVWGAASTPGCAGGNLFKVPAYAGTGTTITVSSAPSAIPNVDPFFCSAGVAIDGSGTVWTSNQGGTSGEVVTPPNIAGYNPSLSANTLSYVSPSIGNGPRYAAVDGSGNVWVLLQDNTVTEFIGVAVPAVTPLSVAVKNKKLGAKP